MKQYIRNHLGRGAYREAPEESYVFENTSGWRDYLIGEHLLYSHRKNDYTGQPFEETHHFHEQYELQFYISGNVDFVCGTELFSPRPLAAIWFCPGEMHNTRMPTHGVFERVVFRFRPDAFAYGGKIYPFHKIFDNLSQRHYAEISPDKADLFLSLFDHLDRVLTESEDGRLAAFALTVEVLLHLSECLSFNGSGGGRSLPEQIRAVKFYIDENYASISSVGEIAAHFFYSREHLSRLFRKYCNTTVAEYLSRYRLRQSLRLLEEGTPVTEACFAVGFGSMSAYIASFKKNIGLLPSEYARRRRNEES